MTTRFRITIAIVVCATLTGVSRAAEFSFEPIHDTPETGFTVRVMLGITDDINAFEGVVRYDSALIEPALINDGSGVVAFWVERPHRVTGGTIRFAGIVPGGLQKNVRDRVELFSVTFSVLSAGTAELSVDDALVYLNTPGAVQDTVRSVPLSVILDDSDVGTFESGEDSVPPEPFMPEVVRGLPVGDGATVVVFAVRDFQSGIATTEVRERPLGLFGAWEERGSPSVLSWWWPFSIIEVRATDHAGNIRVERTVPMTLPLFAIVLAAGALVMRYRLRT